MEKKVVTLQNRGMARDLSISKAPKEFAFENYNIRITVDKENTLLSVTNERGNKVIDIIDENTKEPLIIRGVLIGYGVLNEHLILFTTVKGWKSGASYPKDYVYRITYDRSRGSFTGFVIFNGNLNFNYENPIECVLNYESENLQKIYWVDGINQPRMAIFQRDDIETISSGEDLYKGFDFLTEFRSGLTWNIYKEFNGPGYFSPGTVQYFFTYSNKFGQETSIVDWTAKEYITFENRAASADESVGNTFLLRISNVDNRFDYLNVYVVYYGTSITLNKVGEIYIKGISDKESVEIVDDGVYSEPLDPTVLQYLGGTEVIPYTISHKDNTLFLGNLKLTTASLDEGLNTALSEYRKKGETGLEVIYSDNKVPEYAYDIEQAVLGELYPYNNELNENSSIVKVFKSHEKYRIGVVFITSTGQRSSVYWIDDIIIDKAPKYQETTHSYNKAIIKWTIPPKVRTALNTMNPRYTRAFLVRAVAQDSDRSVVSQGIIFPSTFSLMNRINNTPFGQQYWFSEASIVGESSHMKQLGGGNSPETEVQNNTFTSDPYYTEAEVSDQDQIAFYFVLYSFERARSNQDYYRAQVRLYAYKKKATDERYTLSNVWTNGTQDEHTTLFYTTEDGCLWDWIYGDPNSPMYGLKTKDAWKTNEAQRLFELIKGNNWHKGGWVDFMLSGFPGGDLPGRDTSHATYDNYDWNKKQEARDFSSCIIITDVKGGEDAQPGIPNFIYNLPEQSIPNTFGEVGKQWVVTKKIYNNFYLDSNLVTFHSPNLTEDTVSLYNNLKCKLRYVGIVPITGRTYSYDINVDNVIEYPNYHVIVQPYNKINPTPGVDTVKAIGAYSASGWVNQSSTTSRGTAVHMIYPWHKEYSINNLIDSNNNKVAVLKTKKMAQRLFGGYTRYINPVTVSEEDSQITALSAGNEGTVGVSLNSAGDLYYSDVDLMLIQLSSQGDATANITPFFIYTLNGLSELSDLTNLSESNIIPDKASIDKSYKDKFDDIPEWVRVTDPIRMTYKTLPHLVFSLGNISGSAHQSTITLPILSYDEDTDNEETDYSIKRTEIDLGLGEQVFFPWKHYNSVDPSTPITVISVEESKISAGNNDIVYPAISATENSAILRISDETAEFLKNCGTYVVFRSSDFEEGRMFLAKVNSTELIPQEITGNISNVSIIKGGDTYTFSTSVYYSVACSSVTMTLYLKTDEGLESVNTQTQALPSAGTLQFSYTFDSKVNLGSTYIVEFKATAEDSVHYSVNDLSSEYTYTEDTGETEESGNSLYRSALADNDDSETRASSEEWNYRINFEEDSFKSLADSELTVRVNVYNRYYEIINGESFNELLPEGEYIYETRIPIGYTGDKFLRSYRYALLAELYNDFSGNEYGGNSEYALESNVFVAAGKIFDVDSGMLIASEGDQYFQRYDSLRTLPRNSEDTNQIIDIFSFMVETPINIGGRYDKRRQFTDIENTTEENFNLMNSMYSSDSNILSFGIIDNKYSLTEFPSQITWSKTKTATEDVDTWTNITLASVLDMDGDKGPVRAIRRFGNNLISFQDKGIAEILYNTRTQMATEQGVPIELANSGKVDGKRYITDKAGCVNKWSIVETTKGIYFIDNITSSISFFNGNISSLSDTRGFKAWIGRLNNTSIWNPVDFSNFRGYWDKTNDDVYFLKDMENEYQNTLCYNEQLNQFASFYSYGNTPMMINVEDRFIAARHNNIEDPDNSTITLWLQNEGNYNEIFGEYQPFHVLYRVTPDPYGDKIFTNLEYRADTFDMNVPTEGNLYDNYGTLTNHTFETLEVWNEYQKASISLDFDRYIDRYSDVRRKFRIWRTDIPRDQTDNGKKYKLDRIRNPWIYLKLIKNTSADNPNERMEIHDINVIYYE